MKASRIVKELITVGVIFLMLFFFSTEAFSWGDATHVYISDRLKARFGRDNINEMWGSLGPDIFNFIFDEELCPSWLSEQTHGGTIDSFIKVWNAAGTISEKALAYGFLSHNEVWGTDFTAHISGLKFGQGVGYINAKAMVLLDTPTNPIDPYDPDLNPKFSEIFSSIGMEPFQQLSIAHVIAEYAIDIMLKNDVDRSIGRKLKVAARARSSTFPGLLVDAYAADYAANCTGIDYPTAAYIITSAEAEYRNNMVFYGKVISQSESIAVQRIAEQIVALAPGFLGGPLPIPEEDAVEIIILAIYASMEVCDDYINEINATIGFVENNLLANGIIY